MSPQSEVNPDFAAMTRLREGEDLALNEIMDRWQRRLTSYLLRFTGNETVAIDLAQETFVRVYQSRERYRPAGEFSTWLFAIATNLARQHFRWTRRHPAVSMDETRDDGADPPLKDRMASSGASPDEAALASERASAVRTAVAALPEDLRQVVVLSEYEDLSHAQIARVAGCTPKAVETRLYRARAILRERLNRWLS
ncbi:sigma-70 family RNA polymerase sigma factor [soil metagenome]